MIVKFFGNKGGGSAKSSIDYLAGKNRDREEAKILKGDPDLSISIAESLDFKNKYTVGCLSFEEANIPEKDKKEIMDKFEKTFMAGLEKEQYNITWIEHRDKGRLELNFFIPNVELESGKRLQPYYDKADRHLADNFKKTINYEYGLSNPDLKEKKQLIKNDLTTPRTTKEFKEEITKIFAEKVAEGFITSRDQIEDELEKIGLEITRVTANSISIKNPDPDSKRNIRLDGEIYRKEFYEEVRIIAEFKEQHRSNSARSDERSAERKGNCEGISKEDHERNTANLQRGIEKRTERHQELYPKKAVLDFDNDSFHGDFSRNRSRNELIRNEVEERHSEIESGESVITTIRTIYETRSSADERKQRVERNIHLQQVAKERRLQHNERNERIKTTRIEGFINELSRRAESFISGAREVNNRFKEFSKNIGEQLKGISEFVSKSKERTDQSSKYYENARNIHDQLKSDYEKIGEREREDQKRIDREREREQGTLREIKESLTSWENEDKLIERAIRENAITQRAIEVTALKEKVVEKESSWDLER